MLPFDPSRLPPLPSVQDHWLRAWIAGTASARPPLLSSFPSSLLDSPLSAALVASGSPFEAVAALTNKIFAALDPTSTGRLDASHLRNHLLQLLDRSPNSHAAINHSNSDLFPSLEKQFDLLLETAQVTGGKLLTRDALLRFLSHNFLPFLYMFSRMRDLLVSVEAFDSLVAHDQQSPADAVRSSLLLDQLHSLLDHTQLSVSHLLHHQLSVLSHAPADKHKRTNQRSRSGSKGSDPSSEPVRLDLLEAQIASLQHSLAQLRSRPHPQDPAALNANIRRISHATSQLQAQAQ